jgi:hypothetical protein
MLLPCRFEPFGQQRAYRDFDEGLFECEWRVAVTLHPENQACRFVSDKFRV